MWSLYNEKGDALKPLVFSNGKSQEDVVNEVLDAAKQGHKVIFIKGVCGTGKSAIALNIAKEIGKASIVVPIKSLQKQYEEDYTHKKYLLKNNNEKLRIKVLTGRGNHKCSYLMSEPEEFYTPKERKEKDSKISDFELMLNKLIEKKNEEKINVNEIDSSCDNPYLPCRIEIKEKNMKRIWSYLEKNHNVNVRDFDTLKKVRRMSIAPICPYWCPIVPSEVDLNLDGRIRKYKGLQDKEYKIYQRKEGCGYYDQFNAYLDADVMIFNSQKYKLEVVMNRKPETEVEIIDECDEFLDSFANTKKININRMNLALGRMFSDNEGILKIVNELIDLSGEMLKSKKISESVFSEEIIPLKETKIFEVLRLFLDSNFMEDVECDEENYCYLCDEAARTFEHFIDESYVSFHQEDRELVARIVTTSLEKRFKELLDKSKVIVMMSGTIHSEEVLKDVFGLKDFKIIEAETKMPGTITKQRTGYEINCSFESLRREGMRQRYLNALIKCIENAKKPLLIHVTAFKDLPSEQESQDLGLNIMTKEKLEHLQDEDSLGKAVSDFKKGKADILFSTKCNRGVDFPRETCNSIIITRYPYPDINSIFWKILKKNKPEYYNEFYADKSRREFLQRIYRGLRSQDDHIFLLSPDTRVLNAEALRIE